jgi:hypothetical protein
VLKYSSTQGRQDPNQPVFDFHDSVHKDLRELSRALHVRPRQRKNVACGADVLKRRERAIMYR